MEQKTKPNDYAFATSTDGHIQEGMSKLEYFSAMAMQGILSACDIMSGLPSYEGIAKDSVAYAKALINELNKVEP